MKFSFISHADGIVMSYLFSMGWELTVSLHKGTRGHEVGYWEALILVPNIEKPGRVKSVSLEWLSLSDVANLYDRCSKGDRSVLNCKSGPTPYLTTETR